MKSKSLLITIITAISLFAFIMPPKGSYTIDTKATKVRWTGFHLAKSYEHTGLISVKSGSVDLKKGKIIGGEIVIDMNSISCTDLEGEKKAKLEGHLKNDDFFAVDKFPEAKLVITGSESIADNVFATSGDLTIRGITKPITFETTVKDASESKFAATAVIMVPRTEFEVMYGWKVENAILGGEFKLEVDFTATK